MKSGTYPRARALSALGFVLALSAWQIGNGPARADYTDGLIASSRISLAEGIRVWRKVAWQSDDFLSEIKLGDIYGDDRGDNKYYDPVEAYVWYFIATKSGRIEEHISDANARREIANEYHRARSSQQRLLLNMDAADRAEAHDRIIYIMACRGADGFVQLGQIHSIVSSEDRTGDEGESPALYDSLSDMWRSKYNFRERADREFDVGDAAAARQILGIPFDSVIVPNQGEALMFFHIADNMGHPLAKEYLRGLDRTIRSARRVGPRVADDAANRARYWSPPFEYYPAGASPSGVPYTDECVIGFDRQRSLELVEAGLPDRAIRQAMSFIGWPVSPVGAAKFQASIGDVQTGRLNPLESVRLIQTAALRGDASSQNALGVMYAKGIGVIRNYVRAAYWFQKAGDQRYGAALYHLGVLYKAGPDGIHQDMSRASELFTASALAGFRPTMNQLGELLNRAANSPGRGGQH